MRYIKLISTLVFCLLFLSTYTFATTIIPAKNMGEMIDFSEEVVYSNCSDIKEIKAENGNIYVEYTFTVLSNIKGSLSTNSTFKTRSVSYRTEDGYIFHVEDEGTYVLGKNYVMPLKKISHSYAPTMLSYGVLEEIKIDGVRYLVRTKESYDYSLISLDDIPVENYGPYEMSNFLQYATDYTATKKSWNEQMIRIPNLQISTLNRESPAHCTNIFDGSEYPVRWENPENPVPAYQANTLSNEANIETIVSNSISTINTDFGVNMTDGGTTTQTVSCNTSSEEVVSPFIIRAVTIIYADPCDNIADLSGCSGVLGLGGAGAFGTHTFNGMTWYSAAGGRITVNNGVECLSDTNYERFLTHELGHTIGLGHIANSDGTALMNPNCCNAVTTLDTECADFMYLPLEGLPVDFIDFKVSVEEGIATLNWLVTNEFDVDSYSVEHSVDGVNFKQIENITSLNVGFDQGSYTSFHKPNVSSTSHYYRIRQRDFDGSETSTEIVVVHLEDLFSTPVVNYNQGILTVSSDLAGPNATISVAGITGQVLLSEKLNSNSKSYQTNLRDLPTGIYVVSIESGQDRLVRKIFVD